ADGDRFDDVGIQRALRKVLGLADRLQGLLEHLHERAADDLPLLFRILDSLETAKEDRRCIDHAEVDVEMVAVQLLNRLAFVLAQQAVVDEHARQLPADRTMYQRRGYRRIDAS